MGSSMRNLILLLLGIALGAAGGVVTVNTLNRRDAYPRGVMNVMQHHLAMLRHEAQLHRCEAETTSPALANLHGLAGDLEQTFYPDDTPDAPFREYAQQLRDALAAASAATDCSSLAPNVEKIGVACDACHRQYR
jgi:cytochrome c556